MKKNTRVDWIDRNIHDCLNAGIPVHLFFMIGFPTETKRRGSEHLSLYRECFELFKTGMWCSIFHERIYEFWSRYGVGMFGIIPISMVSL